tara:strand:+ start:4600 stop:5529 length:930 start_codon:yes stop_codon:yes gene_type:complete
MKIVLKIAFFLFMQITSWAILATERVLAPTSTGGWVKVARIQNANPINGDECSSFSGTINVQTDFGESGIAQYYAIFSFGSRGGIKPLLQEFGNAANRIDTDPSRVEWRIYTDLQGWHYLWFWQSNYSRYAAFDYQNACGIEYWTMENPPTDFVQIWSSLDGERQYSDSTFNSLYLLENLGIGTANPGNYKLAVNGDIHAREVKVDLVGWPDYVFKEDHDLPSLEEVEKHIREKGRLINIPSAKEVEENGIQLGEINKLLLEKIEELTLYILEQHKDLESKDSKIKSIENNQKELKAQLSKIQSLINNQ